MKKTALTIISVLLFINCTDKQNRRIVYPQNEDKPNRELIDNSKENIVLKNKLIVGLPQKLDSSNCVLFPIKRINIYNSKNERNALSKISYSPSNYSIPLENLLFKNINTGEAHYLTNNKIKIASYEQLYSRKRNPEKIIIYKIINDDSNKDGVLNNNDITSLYISDVNGENFQQLSNSNHQLIEWNYIYESGKIYFRTSVDTNKDGDFDNSDKLLLYSVSINNFSNIEKLFTDIN